MQKLLSRFFFTKFGGKEAHGPREEPVDFACPDHWTRKSRRIMVWIVVSLWLQLGEPGNTRQHWVCYTRRLINSNNKFIDSGSAVLAKVCALLKALMVYIKRDVCNIDLYGSRAGSAVHPAGHVDRVSPDVVLRLAGADDSSHHRTHVYTYSSQRQPQNSCSYICVH